MVISDRLETESNIVVVYRAVFASAMQDGVDIFFGAKLHSARTVESDMAEQRNGIIGPGVEFGGNRFSLVLAVGQKAKQVRIHDLLAVCAI